MRFLNKRSKSDPKATVRALRQAIAGESLIDDGFKGIDLSKLSVSQLNRIREIRESTLSEDEKRKEIELILNNGLEPITGFKLTDGNEVIREERKPFTWFESPSQDDVDGYRKPSWFMSHEDAEPVTIPKPEPPKKSFAQRLQGLFSNSTERSEVSESPKNEPQLSHRDLLRQKMAEMEDQMEMDLQIRNKSRAWMKLQSYL